MDLRDFLNKLKWDDRFDSKEYSLTYIHRGVKDDELTINCSEIIEVLKGSFSINSVIFDEVVTIPYHRIKRITNHEGINLYIKGSLYL